MQYATGTVTATEGSQSVTGVDTKWLNIVSAGNLFKLSNSRTFYYVAHVVSNSQLMLTQPFSEMTQSGASYAITGGFTPNRKYPELRIGDRDPASLITKALNMIDEDLFALRSVMFLEPSLDDIVLLSETLYIALDASYQAGRFTCVPAAEDIYITEDTTFFWGGHSIYESITVSESLTATMT